MTEGDFEIGTRIQLSELGVKRSPRLSRRTGIITGKTRGFGYYVMLDGNRTPTLLHGSYIEPAGNDA